MNQELEMVKAVATCSLLEPQPLRSPPLNPPLQSSTMSQAEDVLRTLVRCMPVGDVEQQ
jgi:hypothetical protein